MASSRAQVLACFRSLHRTRKKVFDSDALALADSRKKIREEFLKYKNEKDPRKIQDLIQLGYEVERVLRTSVIQARLTEKGNYRLRVTEDHLFDSINPFQKT